MPANVTIKPDIGAAVTSGAPAPVKPKPSLKPHSKIFVEYYASIFLFLIAAYIGLAFYILIPIIKDIRQTNAMIQNQINTAEQERRYLSTLEQSVAAAEAIPETTLDRVNQALPYAAELPSLLRQLGYAAQRNNVRIDSLNMLEAKAAVQTGRAATTTQFVMPIDINLSLRAKTYFDIKRFLADIEANVRLMDVVGLSSSYSGTEFSYTLQMRTYLFTGKTKS